MKTQLLKLLLQNQNCYDNANFNQTEGNSTLFTLKWNQDILFYCYLLPFF